MVFGEVVPRYLALADPERALLRLSIFNRVYVVLFRPVIRVVQALGNAGTRLLGVEPRADLMSAHTVDEISRMLAESHEEGLIEETAHDLLSGALDFGERPVRDVMVPRDDIMLGHSADDRSRRRRSRVVASGHSRLLVAGRDLDDIVGFVHAKDLLTVPAEARDRPLPLARIRRVLVAPRASSRSTRCWWPCGGRARTSASSSTKAASSSDWPRSKTCWRCSSATSATSPTRRRSAAVTP